MRGPRRPLGTPPASRVLTVRVPDALGMALDARAEAEGLTAGTVARRALVCALDADQVQAVPVRRYRPMRPAPSLDRLAVAQLREAVGEAVGTLRQVAGLDRSRSGARLAELDGAIDRLLAEVPRLDALKDALP